MLDLLDRLWWWFVIVPCAVVAVVCSVAISAPAYLWWRMGRRRGVGPYGGMLWYLGQLECEVKANEGARNDPARRNPRGLRHD